MPNKFRVCKAKFMVSSLVLLCSPPYCSTVPNILSEHRIFGHSFRQQLAEDSATLDCHREVNATASTWFFTSSHLSSLPCVSLQLRGKGCIWNGWPQLLLQMWLLCSITLLQIQMISNTQAAPQDMPTARSRKTSECPHQHKFVRRKALSESELPLQAGLFAISFAECQIIITL